MYEWRCRSGKHDEIWKEEMNTLIALLLKLREDLEKRSY